MMGFQLRQLLVQNFYVLFSGCLYVWMMDGWMPITFMYVFPRVVDACIVCLIRLFILIFLMLKEKSPFFSPNKNIIFRIHLMLVLTMDHFNISFFPLVSFYCFSFNEWKRNYYFFNFQWMYITQINVFVVVIIIVVINICLRRWGTKQTTEHHRTDTKHNQRELGKQKKLKKPSAKRTKTQLSNQSKELPFLNSIWICWRRCLVWDRKSFKVVELIKRCKFRRGRCTMHRKAEHLSITCGSLKILQITLLDSWRKTGLELGWRWEI